MRNDDAVQEVIGFILMFALSSIILIISVQSFTTAKEDSEDVLAAVEMKAVASRVATRLVQAGIVSQDFPAAWFNVTLNVPPQVAGHEYEVEIEPAVVTVRSLNGALTATSTTFRLDAYAQNLGAGQSYEVRGRAISAQQTLVLSYSCVPTSLTCADANGQFAKVIELKGAT